MAGVSSGEELQRELEQLELALQERQKKLDEQRQNERALQANVVETAQAVDEAETNKEAAQRDYIAVSRSKAVLESEQKQPKAQDALFLCCCSLALLLSMTLTELVHQPKIPESTRCQLPLCM